MEITSSAFANNERIPMKYTCEGQNINPPLDFHNIPKEAKSLALIVEDPDAPAVKPWVHWVLFNLSPSTTHIEENVAPSLDIEGIGTHNALGYKGPCPPDKEHRYFFKLYALDTKLQFSDKPDRATVLKAMDGHIIAEAELIGLYDLKSR